MRTIKTDLYLYDELNETDDDAYRNTLERIEEVFQIDVYNWNTDYLAYRYRFTNERWSDHGEDPKMLVRYLNYVSDDIFKGRYFSTDGRYENGKYHYSCRYSKVLSDADEWPLTGVWCDEAVTKAIKDTAKYIRAGWTIRDFLDSMLSSFFYQWYTDYSNNRSDENVEDYLEGNSRCEFLADGTRYN